MFIDGFQLLLGLGALAVAGLLGIALRPGRRGDTPHCRACNYNLTGIASECCPECGVRLDSHAIVYGERNRSLLKALSGCALLVLAAMGCAALAWHVDYYSYLPFRLLLREVESLSPPASDRAWSEIARRESVGALSADHRARLVDLCLQWMLTHPKTCLREWNYLAKSKLAGRLPDDKQKQFVQQSRAMLTTSLRVRRKVVAGEAVPYRYDCVFPISMELAWTEPQISIDEHPVTSVYDAVALAAPPRSTLSAKRHVTAGQGSAEIGRHTLVAAGEFSIHSGGRAVLGPWKVSMQSEFVTVPSGAGGPLSRIHDPSATAGIRSALRMGEFSLRDGALSGSVRVDAANLPYNLAFDVIVRVNGQEQVIDTLCFDKQEPHEYQWFGMRGEEFRISGPFDFILRASDRAARQSVDIVEFWDGELVYENLQVPSKGSDR